MSEMPFNLGQEYIPSACFDIFSSAIELVDETGELTFSIKFCTL
jgi:hypothetical protein